MRKNIIAFFGPLALVSALAVTGAVTACTLTPSHAEVSNPGGWRIVARNDNPDGTKSARPYAPGGQVVTYADEASCNVSLAGETLQTALNGLRLYLLINVGEEAMESVEAACEPAE